MIGAQIDDNNIHMNIWKKKMDSNLTICEEKLTTSNPNRKWRFIEKQSQSIL